MKNISLFFIIFFLSSLFANSLYFDDYSVKEYLMLHSFSIENDWDDLIYYTLDREDEMAIVQSAEQKQALTTSLTPKSLGHLKNVLLKINHLISQASIEERFKEGIRPYFTLSSLDERAKKGDPYLLDCPSLALTQESENPLMTFKSYETLSEDSEEFLALEKTRFSEELFREKNPHFLLKQKTKWPSAKEVQNYLQKYLAPATPFLALAPLSLVEVLFSCWIETNISTSLINHVPLTYWAISQGVKTVPAWLNGLSYQLLGNKLTMILSAPLIEELFFRYLLQKVALHELPRMVLEKMAPQYSYLADEDLLKLSRIVLTSSMFALGHIPAHAYGRYMTLPTGIPQLLGGILYGTIVEGEDNTLMALTTTTLSHALHNFWCVLLSK